MATRNTQSNAIESTTIETMEHNTNVYPAIDWRKLVPDTSKSDSIAIQESDNNLLLGTRKLKVQVEIGLGKHQDYLAVTDKLPVTIAKSFDAGNCTKTVYLPVLQLLTAASNGLFELANTNPKDSKQFDELIAALENGYFYPSSYAASLKKEPFSWATFVADLNIDLESNTLTSEQALQYSTLKLKAPKLRELSAFFTDAYNSPKWVWLKERLDAAGYTVGVVSDDLASLL